MLRDFVYADRLLRKSPGVTAVIILALALGTGANTSTYVSVKAILLHPFRHSNLDRIMTVWETPPKLNLVQAESPLQIPWTFRHKIILLNSAPPIDPGPSISREPTGPNESMRHA